MKNKYNVQAKQWARWSEPARAMFNGIYSRMITDQGLFKHPETAMLPISRWETTAWNAAWMAADLLMGIDAVAERR